VDLPFRLETIAVRQVIPGADGFALPLRLCADRNRAAVA
jgi:hypothetical protein